jgi:SH3-like domain-containing protein
MRTRTAAEASRRLGWSLALLALLGASALPAQEADSQAPRFVPVQVDIANLRARPASTAEQIRSACENEPLHVAGRQGRWLKMRDVAGEAIWIYAPLTDAARRI